jgi:hypothetical protein
MKQEQPTRNSYLHMLSFLNLASFAIIIALSILLIYDIIAQPDGWQLWVIMTLAVAGVNVIILWYDIAKKTDPRYQENEIIRLLDKMDLHMNLKRGKK